MSCSTVTGASVHGGIFYTDSKRFRSSLMRKFSFECVICLISLLALNVADSESSRRSRRHQVKHYWPPPHCVRDAGRCSPIAMKISLTFIAVLAEVSMKSKLLSSAYACASWGEQRGKVGVGGLSRRGPAWKSRSLPGDRQRACWPGLLCFLPER